MYGKEMFQKGIYGVVNLATNHMVYIGSTQISFVSRWGQHSSDLKYNRHCNKELSNLFRSGNFEFVIIEAGEFTNKELLLKEKYYTEKYNVSENGYCVHVGGGKLQTPFMSANNNFEEDSNIKLIRLYIEENWFNKKLYSEDKTTIENQFNKVGIDIGRMKFMALLRRTGFVIQRFSDKKSWLISEKNY